MTGKTNAASGGNLEIRNQIIKTGAWTDSTSLGLKTHREVLTGLVPKQQYLVIINPWDGGNSLSNMSLSSPDIQAGTYFRIPNLNNNTHGCFFCPLKADITLTITWTRIGGMNQSTSFNIL